MWLLKPSCPAWIYKMVQKDKDLVMDFLQIVQKKKVGNPSTVFYVAL